MKVKDLILHNTVECTGYKKDNLEVEISGRSIIVSEKSSSNKEIHNDINNGYYVYIKFVHMNYAEYLWFKDKSAAKSYFNGIGNSNVSAISIKSLIEVTNDEIRTLECDRY